MKKDEITDEINKYRAQIERRYKDRRTRSRRVRGQRKLEYPTPSMWSPAILWQFILLMLGGALMIIMSGCDRLKEWF